MPISILIIILIVIALLAYFIRNRAKSTFSENERRLIKRCYGDESQAERLINLELNKNPRLSRAEAAAKAFQSILRDNR